MGQTHQVRISDRRKRKESETRESSAQPPGGRECYCAQCWYHNRWPDKKKGYGPLRCRTCGSSLIQDVPQIESIDVWA